MEESKNRLDYILENNKLVSDMFDDLRRRSHHQAKRIFNLYFKQSPGKQDFLIDAEYCINEFREYELSSFYESKMAEKIIKIIEKEFSKLPNQQPAKHSDPIGSNSKEISEATKPNPETKVIDKEFLTLTEVCELLSLKKQTIYGKVSRREIPYIKKGNRLYFKKTEILDWLESGSRKTTKKR